MSTSLHFKGPWRRASEAGRCRYVYTKKHSKGVYLLTLMTMITAPKHQRLIGGLLLICSLISLLMFLEWRYFAAPPGIDGQALAEAFSTQSAQMYERFTGGALARSHLWHFSGAFVPAMLVLTAALAVWNFRLCRRQP
jgi:hypothetical protein